MFLYRIFKLLENTLGITSKKKEEKQQLIFHDFGCQNKHFFLRHLHGLTDGAVMLCTWSKSNNKCVSLVDSSSLYRWKRCFWNNCMLQIVEKKKVVFVQRGVTLPISVKWKDFWTYECELSTGFTLELQPHHHKITTKSQLSKEWLLMPQQGGFTTSQLRNNL